ncbi:type 1 glutamine amidotransferase [Carboxydothermus pertinax]|uniref:Lipid II isoglutaminyl synthase (glutamine-hydrolyzing) subunit GatD n=1 Tax=Carboxydothermus pertinax TaxID=870242 RepID=A0A1L8CRT8_9THEO|nr:glutamine amidotransferase [Carboxydothermus pertinax]GAV21519.1 glutamine amidotransferase [Carboxydothermus pertinax]
MYELTICHLYPDLLNTYGDIGNIIALKMRSQWRGIKVNIKNISLGDKFKACECDLIFIGGGQDFEQELIQKDFLQNKGNELKTAIENNQVVLAVCGGYQLLGKFYRTAKGKEIECLGALDLWTVAGAKRMIGNILIESEILKIFGHDGKIIGFENHSGKTYLGPKVKPLGRVITGYGNNGEDGFEGVVYKNVIGTYLHGSVLPKNPVLTDYLLTLALKRKYPEFNGLKRLNDDFENIARNRLISRLSGKGHWLLKHFF